MADPNLKPKVVLFGYDSSVFTQKIRLALKLRQIKYTFVIVPSMMPRAVLVDMFHLTYRKIPVLAIDKDIYIDTSLILEIIHAHPAFTSHPPLHTSQYNRALSRLLSPHYTDRPLFRLTTGTIPQRVWETSFGTDRANLIGHDLNATKLGAKIPRNIAMLDTYLGIMEDLCREKWILDTQAPSAADISLYCQLDWGERISRGEGINDLTGGRARDGPREQEGINLVFSVDRYPKLFGWFSRMKAYMGGLPGVETRVEQSDVDSVARLISELNEGRDMVDVPLIRTPAGNLDALNEKIGLTLGSRVSVAPDDTGRNSPSIGTVVALSTEEVVIVPDIIHGNQARVRNIRTHFPKVGFVVKPLTSSSGETVSSEKPRSKL